MPDLTTVVKRASALHQAVAVAIEAGAAMSLLDAVLLDTNSKLQKSAGASSKMIGIAVAGTRKASDGAIVSGETVTVVTFGPVVGFSGLTPGRLVYLSSTAGKLADSGTVPVGYVLDANTVFVMPGIANAAS